MKNDPTTPFGDRLRRLREEAGLTQAALAEAAGLARATLNNWEGGAATPRLEAAAAVARALAQRLPLTAEQVLGRLAGL